MTENFDADAFLLRAQPVLENKNFVSSNNNINQLEYQLHDVQPSNNISNASDEGILVQQAENGIIKTHRKLISGYDWKNKKIVIVEDDEQNVKYLQTILRRTFATAFIAADGTSFREIPAKVPDIDLILMDIQLPMEDGWQLTRFVKSVRNEIPVIAQTAYGMESDRIKSLEAGCDNFIAKPISPDDMLNMIALYLE